MHIPKTAKGLSSRITKIRSELSAFKREYGFIDDGAGHRYYLFYLYYLLGDNRRSSECIQWFQREFPDDVGEPVQLLCWALMLHRNNKKKAEAEYQLGRAMLSNIYLLPFVLDGEGAVDRIDMRYGSNWEEPEHVVNYFPAEILKAITDEEKQWVRDKYNSDTFKRILHRYIDINIELQDTPVGDKRSALVQEQYSLLDRLL